MYVYIYYVGVCASVCVRMCVCVCVGVCRVGAITSLAGTTLLVPIGDKNQHRVGEFMVQKTGPSQAQIRGR